MDHDKLLSGRVKARFSAAALQRAADALHAAKVAAFDDIAAGSASDEQLEDALDAWRLLRGLKAELEELAE